MGLFAKQPVNLGVAVHRVHEFLGKAGAERRRHYRGHLRRPFVKRGEKRPYKVIRASSPGELGERVVVRAAPS